MYVTFTRWTILFLTDQRPDVDPQYQFTCAHRHADDRYEQRTSPPSANGRGTAHVVSGERPARALPFQPRTTSGTAWQSVDVGLVSHQRSAVDRRAADDSGAVLGSLWRR